MRLLAALLMAGVPAAAEVSLVGDTSRPELSLFAPGEPVRLTFTATGLSPGEASLQLAVEVVDEHDRLVRRMDLPVRADAEGRWQATVDAPRGRLGFYRVRAKLSNGVTLPKLGSRAAGYLTYGVVPDPRQRRLYPQRETFFGLQGGFSGKVNLPAYLGVRWVLGGYAWRDLEPEKPGEMAARLPEWRKMVGPPPQWEVAGKPWRTYPMPTLFFAPKWAVTPDTLVYCTGTLTREGEVAWRNYCVSAARAFAAEHPDLEEHIYQITWEPVYPWGFRGTDEDLIRIYRIAYPALHQADPKAVVVGPTGAGINREGVDWNANLLRKGIGKYLDAFSIHPYHAVPPEPLGLVERVRELKELIRQHVGRNLPLLGTEQGSATGEDPGKELDQARGLLRANLIMLGEGFRLNFGFYAADYPTEPGYGYCYNLNPNIPWGTDKVSPKPIAPAYAFQSFLLEGHRSAGPIEWLGATALGYAYERGNHVVLALWDYGDTPRRVSVPVGVPRVTVYDWMGNGRRAAAPRGVLPVTLGPEPLYVEGVAPSLWGSRAPRPVRLAQPRLAGFPGMAAVLTGTVAGGGVVGCEVDPRLGIAVPTRRLPGKGGGRQPLHLSLPVPADAEPGLYPVRVTLTREGRALGTDGALLVVRPPVTVERVEPARDSHGDWAVRVQLRDAANRAQVGTVRVRLQGVPETGATAAFRVPAKGAATVTLAIRDLDLPPSRVAMAAVGVTMASGYRFSVSRPINFFGVPRLAGQPRIDGALAEWERVPAVLLRGREMLVRSPAEYEGAGDLAGELRLAWGPDALYVAVAVTDDVFLQEHTGFETWKGDCLQLAFDLDPGKEAGRTGNLLADAGARHRACEVDLALTRQGPEAYRTLSWDPERLPVRLLRPDELALAVVQGEGSLRYEAAIPWRTLGLARPPRAGDRFGFALTINDMDRPQQLDPAALGLFGGITPTKDPQKHGVIVLDAGGLR